MPTTKLTLSADKELIRQAKKLAAQQNTSLSALFSRLIRVMTHDAQSREARAPLTKRASGLIHLPADSDYKDLLAEALARK